MTTLVTGATGHVGANLVRELVNQGNQVRVLLRPPGTAQRTADQQKGREGLAGLEVETIEGDLRDENSLRTAVDGCDRVYHVAALVSIRSSDKEALTDVNVMGTRRLLDACRDAGVKRIVHTSSFGAVGSNPNGPSTENDFIDPYESTTDYEKSKAFAEVEVLKQAVRGLEVVIVNPSAVIGPNDFRPSMMGKTMIDFAHGKLKAFIPGAFDFVPAQDVTAGHLLAMEKGTPGERYLLTGEQVSVDQMMQWLSEDTGRPIPRLRIPARAMLPIAVAKDWVDRRLFPERIPRFTRHSIRLLTSGRFGSTERAKRELGLRPTPIRQAFRDAIGWYRTRGWIPAFSG